MESLRSPQVGGGGGLFQSVVPVGSSTPQQDFNGLHVPYVPNSTMNAGIYYDYEIKRDLRIRPMASLQFTGSQYIFNNNGIDSAGNQFPQPSNQKMPAYSTLNVGFKFPYKRVEFNFNAQNVTNNKYLIYEYISSGSYFAQQETELLYKAQGISWPIRAPRPAFMVA